MLAVHKWNAVVSGQFKSFHEPIFLPCLSRHGARPWNPATECRINGQSKQHIRNFNPLTVPTRSPPDGYMPGPLPARLPRSHSLLMRNPTRRRTFGCTDHEVRRSLIQFEEGLAARPFWLRGDELRLNTSGIIHLRPWRAVQFGARSHASADPCQNSLQAGSCIIFFGCPRSKWTSSLSVPLSVTSPLASASIVGIPFRTQASPDLRVGSLPMLCFTNTFFLMFIFLPILS